eukprot:1147540-Pelagomonas_calceolata.AAC.6
MWIITSAYSGQPCDAWMPKARPKGETEGMMQPCATWVPKARPKGETEGMCRLAKFCLFT